MTTPLIEIPDPVDVIAIRRLEVSGHVGNERIDVHLTTPGDPSENLVWLDVRTADGKMAQTIELPPLQMRVLLALAAMLAPKAAAMGFWPSEDDAPDFHTLLATDRERAKDAVDALIRGEPTSPALSLLH